MFIFKKTAFVIVTAVKTSNLTRNSCFRNTVLLLKHIKLLPSSGNEGFACSIIRNLFLINSLKESMKGIKHDSKQRPSERMSSHGPLYRVHSIKLRVCTLSYKLSGLML
jgi:hypothetical protein